MECASIDVQGKIYTILRQLMIASFIVGLKLGCESLLINFGNFWPIVTRNKAK
jgi:hypothetical protein